MELTFDRIALLMYLAECRRNLTRALDSMFETDPIDTGWGPEAAASIDALESPVSIIPSFVWRNELAQVRQQLAEVAR